MKKNTPKSRRQLLKSMAAGSGVIIAGKSLPSNWSKPIVDSVVLPVHAMTSQAGPCTSGLFSQTITQVHTFDARVPPINLSFDFDVAAWCAPAGDGTATLTIIADLSASNLNEYIDVELNGTAIGRVFETTGNQCTPASGPESITLPQATLVAAAATGTVSVNLIPGPSVDSLTACQDQDQIVTLEYTTV